MTKAEGSEKNKIAGVCYAMTTEGVELPIIDVTHPAFTVNVDESELQSLFEEFVRETNKINRMPRFLQRLFFPIFLKRSILGRGLLEASGGFLSGMSTYLLKIGETLTSVSKLDRKISRSLPALSIRLRLQNCAHLLARSLSPILASEKSAPLHFLNIAGGPAMDSLNALILIRKEHPEYLNTRKIVIHVLDLDTDGPTFGKRAVKSLQEAKGPLAELAIDFQHILYDWSRVETMKTVVDQLNSQGCIVVASSEGGLFEYGSDEEIVENLKTLREGVSVMVGSVTSSKGPGQFVYEKSQIRVRPREIEVFQKLVQESGWRVKEMREEPLSSTVLLE